MINWAIVASPESGLGRRPSSASRISNASGRRSASATRLDAPDPVAAWREHDATPQGARGAAQRPRLRRGAVPRPGNGSLRRPDAAVALDVRGVHDRGRHRAHPEPADRGGLHLAGLASHGGNGARDDAARRRSARSCATSSSASRTARSSTSRPRRAPSSSAASSRSIRRRPISARSRSSTATRPSARPGSCSRTRSSTRTRPATSPTAQGLPMAVADTDGLDAGRAARDGGQRRRRAHGLHDRRPRGRTSTASTATARRPRSCATTSGCSRRSRSDGC